jgi:hypothetical protein
MRLKATLATASLAAAAVLLVAAPTAAKADSVYGSQASFSAATSGVTSVGFPSPGYGLFIPDNPASAGAVTFSSSTSVINLDDAAYYTVNGGLPANPANYLIVFGDEDGDVVNVTFPSSTAFSLDLGGTFATGEGVNILLSDGFSYNYTATGYVTSGDGLDFLGFTSSTPLTGATLTFVDNVDLGDFGTISGASYGTAGAAATPEPSSLALLGTGLLVVGFMLRRKLTA